MNATWQDGTGGGGPQLGFPTVTPVVKKLLVLNFAIWVLTFLLSLARPEVVEGLYGYLSLRSDQWFVSAPWLPLWQPLTSGFLHAPNDGWHVILNMVQLYFFGTMLEGILGSRRFLWVYLGAMFAGALLHLTLQPLSDPSVGAVGASGAVLGVMIMTAVLRPQTRVIVMFVPVTLKWLAIGLIALDLIGLAKGLAGQGGMVAHWVHLGGAVFGFAAARKGWIWKDPILNWQNKQIERQASRERDDELRMDDILAKIHKEGMSSLSRSEKTFLKKVSSRR